MNVFETGITLPGRSDVSLPAATPFRLQLCSVRLLRFRYSCHQLATRIVLKVSGFHPAIVSGRFFMCYTKKIPSDAINSNQVLGRGR